jgi:hypothetical protein
MLTRFLGITTVLLVLLLVALQAQAPKAPAQSNYPGRYQLVSSPFSVWMTNGDTNTETTVFKIDTATGNTWKFEYGKASGKLVNGWTEMRANY